METATRELPVAANGTTKKVWIGRAVSALVVLFALFDGITKVLRVPAVVQASGRLGYTANAVAGIGIILLACTVIYAIPRTAMVGAILLTGYLGGAVDANVHAGSPQFETLFPVFFGILVWVGLYLRDDSLRVAILRRRQGGD